MVAAATPDIARPVRVGRIDVLALRAPLSFHRMLSKGATTSAEDRDWVGNPVLIRLESTDGAVGISQVRPPTPWLGETTESIVGCIRHYYGPALMEANLAERQAVIQRLERILPANTVALAALDIAIHDLLGHVYGVPVYELLGGAATEVPMDWSVGLNPTPKIVEESVRAVREFGACSLCLKIGPSERWREDVGVVRAVRDAVGPGVDLAVDPNEGYDVPTMFRFLRELGDEELAYIEQPLPRHRLEDLRAIRAQAPAPVFIDETAIGVPEAYRAITAGACDGIVLKLWKTGGYTNTMKMAAVAEAAGVRTTLGGVAHGSVIEAAACAHLYAAVGQRPLSAQYIMGMNVIDVDPVVPLPDGFRLQGGSSTVPSGPGLGVSADMAAARSIALAEFSVE